jgi:hypothetical protein
MTYEINNFVLDLAGIDRQLTADGPTNYRTFLNRLDQVIFLINSYNQVNVHLAIPI